MESGPATTPHAALMMSAQRVVTECAMKTGSVPMTGAVPTRTVQSRVTASVDLTESACILGSAVQMLTVVTVEHVPRTSPAPFLPAALILTVLSNATESVYQMEPAPTLSAALIPTANMLTLFATFPLLTTETSVTIVMMANVNLVVLTTVWEVRTVPTPTQHVTAMCAAALRMLNAITMTASVI